MVFTIEDIETAWKEYETTDVLRVLKEGKWTTTTIKGQKIGPIDGTKAKMRALSDVMDFPEYLKDIWTK